MSGERAFEAPDLIEVMEEAVNYNRFLVEALLSCFFSDTRLEVFHDCWVGMRACGGAEKIKCVGYI